MSSPDTPEWVKNAGFHRWDPTPVPDIAVRRTEEQARCRFVYPDGRVCGRFKGADDHTVSLLPVATVGQCARCGQAFDPADPAFGGRARYQETSFCRSCVDRCHESTDFAHSCVICGDKGSGVTRA